MKKIITLLTMSIMTLISYAQTNIPQLISFSAVVRDTNNQLLLNTPISIRLTFKQGGQNGTLVYCALHQSTTNQNGFISIQLNRDVIGTGCNGAPSTPFEDIHWENGNFWMEVEYQTIPGSPFVNLGQLELASSFYAFAATTAERLIGLDLNGANDGDVMTYNITSGQWEAMPPSGNNFSGDYNDLTNTPILSPVATTGDYTDLINTPVIPTIPNNLSAFTNDMGFLSQEIQILSISNDTIYLTGGSFVKLPPSFDGQYSSLTGTPTLVSHFANDAAYLTSETDPTVPAHVKAISTINVSDWNTAHGWGDHSTAGYLLNENQVLSINNDSIFLTGGSFVKLPPNFDGQYSSLTAAPTLVSHFTNDAAYLTSETDPTVPAHVKAINNSNISNWNDAYNWGDHSQAGYLINYTETQNLNDILIQGTSAANKNITDLANPINAQDAATKAYVDALLVRIEALEEINILNNGFTDIRDSNHYNAVKIGNQIWMAENLKYLPSVTIPDSGSHTIPYCYVYDYYDTITIDAKATANYNTYGVLYNWAAAMAGDPPSDTNPSGVQGICPNGWHLPSYDEWLQLKNYVNSDPNKLKEVGDTHWNSPNDNATNETGFTALPGGIRCKSYETFRLLSTYAYWWTTSLFTIGPPTNVWYVYIDNLPMQGDFAIDFLHSDEGFSVRCVKD